MNPIWPQKARSALAYLFRPLQDVDIFVEDTGDEVFYTELFRRIAPKNVRIAKVLPLGNRLEVVAKAKQHDFAARRALFLVDGDLEWVRGDAAPDFVHRLDAYCIENILLHEDAATQLVIEESVLAEDVARQKLSFENWLSNITPPLVELFISFAALNAVVPSERTVGHGIGVLLTASKKGVPQQLDPVKIRALISDIQNKTVQAVGLRRSKQLHQQIENRISALPAQWDAVSGKDYLLPLFQFHLAHCTKTKPQKMSLRVRLARHCSLERLKPLAKALADS
jgi:hypothetical protein